MIIDQIRNHKYSILGINCQSLVKNIELLRQAAKTLNTKFICCNEIWQAQQAFTRIQNYHEPVFKNRNSKGGGTGIYVRADATFTFKDLAVNAIKCKIVEHISVETIIDHSPLLVTSIYRPPGSPVAQTLRDLESIFRCLTETGKKYVWWVTPTLM